MSSPDTSTFTNDDAGAKIDEIDALFRRTAEANSALICGDVNRYVSLIVHSDDYTLMAPFGGAPTRGFDCSPERLAAIARFFKSGISELELVQSYASGDMVVLVFIEHQRCEVGGLPAQEWPLRVTQVYRCDNSVWRLVHRHADPLVKGITIERAAAIARGES